MDRKPTYEELEQRVKELEMDVADRKRTEERVKGLNHLRENLLRPGNLDGKIKRITNGMVEIFDADFARIWITKTGDMCDSGCFHVKRTEGPHVCHDRDRCLHLVASSGRYTHVDGDHRRVPFGAYKIGRVASGEEKGFLTNDVTRDPQVHDHDWAERLGLVSFAGYHLLSAAGESIGVLALFSKHAISPDEDAQLEGLASTTSQVIQTAMAEESLLESEEFNRALFEYNPIETIVVDLEGRVTNFNLAKKISGARLPNIGDVMYKDYAGKHEIDMYAELMKCIGSGELRRFHELEYGDKILSITISPFYKGTIITSQDNTERRRAEEERARLEAQFQQSQRMESLGTLAGGVAHDFNNLLMGIQGRTSLMLLDTDFSHPHFEHLKGIEDYIKSAADLTRQLLGFARSGKYEVKPSDLNELLRKSSEMFGRTKKEITIHVKYQESIWTVEIDQGQIEQVLLNIFVNAWQAMPESGELYLETKNVLLDENKTRPFKVVPGKYVKISITDTGRGMDEVTKQRIFDPFFTTKEMGRGTGLGLASVYGIIKNHGGIIDVHSERLKGSTFLIYLPASEKVIIEEKELDKEPLRGTETVLLVDDEEMIIDVGKQILKRLGYEVLISRGGKEAVKLYFKNRDKIDIVILDMIMPGYSGRETYDMLKEIDYQIKVLLSSGYSINGEATEILNRGCDGFIQKPFSMKDLSQKLREILDEKQTS